MSMGIIAVGGALIGAYATMSAADKNAETANRQMTMSENARKEQQRRLDKQIKEYKSMDFENPFADAQTSFENVYEDLTVNQQQAQFQAQQGAQQRSNIMQDLRGSAGSSGIASLAQALANQGQIQTQRISASIGQQESRNQMLAAKGAESTRALEQSQKNMIMQGDQWVQQSEMDRQATILGMQMGQTTGANLAAQQSQANQMQAQMAQNQALVDSISGIGTTAVGAYQNKMFPGQTK